MMMFIDYPDGSVGIPFGKDVLEVSEIAKARSGRLRLMIDRSASTTDPMVGCIQLGDWRPKEKP